MNEFIYVATVLFAFLAYIWSASNLLNVGLKMVYTIMAISGIILAFKINYIIVDNPHPTQQQNSTTNCQTGFAEKNCN